jgi:hypothetical protein
MSKFKVGDRVVVTTRGINPELFGERHVVTEIKDSCPWPVAIGDVLYRDDEVTLESDYGALSAPLLSVDTEVEKCDTEIKGEWDVINHPSHYADGWSNGSEVIDIAEHLNFNRGNAVKYLSRAGKKGGPEKELEDLQKALWYVSREVERIGGQSANT